MIESCNDLSSWNLGVGISKITGKNRMEKHTVQNTIPKLGRKYKNKKYPFTISSLILARW